MLGKLQNYFQKKIDKKINMDNVHIMSLEPILYRNTSSKQNHTTVIFIYLYEIMLFSMYSLNVVEVYTK